MRGLKRETFERINNPEAYKRIVRKDEEREISWSGEIEQFREVAEKIYKNHLLVQKAEKEVKELFGKSRSVLEVPKKHFDEMSDKTGYQEGLIAAVYQIVWDKMEEEEINQREIRK